MDDKKKYGRLIIISLVLLSMFTMTGYSQPLSFIPNGLTVEAGTGHNQLFWDYRDDYESGSADRKEFFLTPHIRLSYLFNLAENISILPFISYNRFGGKSAEKANGYKDEFWINALSGGSFIQYKVSTFNIGAGIKYNYHISAANRHYGYINDIIGTDRTWEKEDADFMFTKGSVDGGIRAEYNITKHFLVSAEGWFGFTSLEKSSSDKNIDIRQNHYRIMFGYRF